MELLTKLGIDWRLLLAQIVNFAILAGVLSAFVYRPLLNLIDARRERVRKAMEDAKRIEEQKEETERHRQDALRKIDEECGVILERTKREAEKAKAEILESAKREADALFSKGREQLEEERAKVFAEVQGTLAETIMRMTEKIIEREFSPSDQKRLVSSLTKEIPQLLR